MLDPSTAPPPISNSNPPLDNPRAMQVIRNKKIADSTRKTNDDYRALLRGTVWENYQLVMTQWPKYPQPEEENGAPFPGQFTGPEPMTNIANTTMETYLQSNCLNLLHGLSRRCQAQRNRFRLVPAIACIRRRKAHREPSDYSIGAPITSLAFAPKKNSTGIFSTVDLIARVNHPAKILEPDRVR